MPDYQVKNVEPVAVGIDIQVRLFTLEQGDVIPWHYHSESTDHFTRSSRWGTVRTIGNQLGGSPIRAVPDDDRQNDDTGLPSGRAMIFSLGSNVPPERPGIPTAVA